MRSHPNASQSRCPVHSSLVLLLGLALPFSFAPSARAERLATGTNLEVSLLTATGSRISQQGDLVQATVIAPVLKDGQLLIPQGSTVAGFVENVDRLGLGLKHLTSAITYSFNKVHLPSGEAIPISAKVVQVEAAKERVDSKGIINGIYPTANISSSLISSVIPILCLEPHFGLPFMGIKVLIARSPDPEIFYPAGTELVLGLTADADFPTGSAPMYRVASLSAADMADAQRIVSELPEQRTNHGRNHPSDLVNILFLGSHEAIDRAFHAAGWLGAQRSSLLSVYRMYHCMVQRIGYSMAPMTKLTLNGVPPSAEYQKGLNTFSKRHHTRLWKQPKEEEAWLSAATEDVDYAVHNMHLTHATDAEIDNERNKVLNDIAYTGCVNSAGLLPREVAGPEASSIRTDGGVAIIRINDCRHPRTMPTPASGAGQRPRAVQALVALRNDVIRANPVFLTYNTVKLVLASRDLPVTTGQTDASGTRRKEPLFEGATTAHWDRPSVLDTMELRSGDSQRQRLLENRLFLPAVPPEFPREPGH